MKRNRDRTYSAIACITGAALLGAGTFAKSAVAQQASPQQWEFYVTPYLWFSGVSGTLKSLNRNIPEQNVEASFGNILSHLDAIPVMVSAEVRYGRFGLLTDIMAISVQSDIVTKNVLFTGGSANLTQVIGSALGTYRVLESGRQSLDVGIGVRAFGMSTKFSLNPGLLPGFSISPSASWADPIVGARYHIDLSPRWGLTAYADIGGGPNSQFTWQLLGSVDYRVASWVVMRIGYRNLRFQYESDALRQNMEMSGPILGATIQF